MIKTVKAIDLEKGSWIYYGGNIYHVHRKTVGLSSFGIQLASGSQNSPVLENEIKADGREHFRVADEPRDFLMSDDPYVRKAAIRAVAR